MKHFVALIVLLTFAFLVGVSSAVELDRQQDGLIGPVHTVVIEKSTISNHYGSSMEGPRTTDQKITYGASGQLTERVQYSDSDASHRLVCRYSDAGQSTEWLIYGPGAKLIKKKIHHHNTDGKPTSEKWYDAAGNLMEQRVYRYSPDGNLIETSEQRADTTQPVSLLMKYDLDGNVSEESLYQLSGTLARRTVYLYVANGQLIETRHHAADDSLQGRTTYLYNANGQVKETASYRADGSLDTKWASKYDAHGNLLNSERRDAEGSPDERGVYRYANRYEYDSFGNWIERHTTEWANQNDRLVREPSEAVYRTITYYAQ